MSARGNHTIAVVKGAEKYETLKESFKNIFDEINALNRTKKLTIDGRDYNVELFLGGGLQVYINHVGYEISNLILTIHVSGAKSMHIADMT
jgi:hypothetical protein